MKPHLKYLSTALLLLSLLFPFFTFAQTLNSADGSQDYQAPGSSALDPFPAESTSPTSPTSQTNPSNTTTNNPQGSNAPVMVNSSNPSSYPSPSPSQNFNSNPNSNTAVQGASGSPIPGRYSSGGASLVRCDGVVTSSGEVACDFNYLIKTVNYIIDWMFGLSIPIAVGILAYAGILYMTGVEKNINKAKAMFGKVAIGFAIMLVAFIFVSTTVGWLVRPGQGFGTLIGQ